MIDRFDLWARMVYCDQINCDECKLEEASGYPWDCTARENLFSEATKALAAVHPNERWQFVNGKLTRVLYCGVCDRRVEANYCPYCGTRVEKGAGWGT